MKLLLNKDLVLEYTESLDGKICMNEDSAIFKQNSVYHSIEGIRIKVPAQKITLDEEKMVQVMEILEWSDDWGDVGFWKAFHAHNIWNDKGAVHNSMLRKFAREWIEGEIYSTIERQQGLIKDLEKLAGQ